MTAFIVMNLLAAASALRAVERNFRFTQEAEFLISWCVLFLAQVVSIGLILGALRILTLGNALLLTAAIFLAVFFFTRHLGANHPSLIIEKWLWAPRANHAVLLVASILLGFAIVKVAINLFNAPFGWDSLNYHFTFAVEWIKNGTLAVPITICDDPSPTYYPLNGSLVYLWLMLPLKSVFAADLGQLPFFVLGFLSVYALARRMKLSSEYSFFASVLFTLVPNYFKQMEIAYVDVMVSALFLAACVYLARLYERFRLSDAVMFGIALGLFIGTKSVSLIYSVVLVVPFLILVLKERRAGALFVAGILVAVFGGFSYFRNFVLTGNPLYPCDVTAFGRIMFPGVIDLATISAHMEAGKRAFMKLLLHEGMGGQTLVFIIPGLFALAAALFVRRKKMPLPVVYGLLICPVTVYLLYRFCIPLANSRYLYPALGLGMVAGLYAARVWGLPRRLIQILVVLCALVSAGETASHAELIACVLVSALLATGLMNLHRLLSGRFSRRAAYVGMAVVTFALAALYPAHAWYLKNEHALYERATDYSGFWPEATQAWKWLNENSRGENISYVGRPVPFPLYGERFKNNVYYTSVNTVDPAKIHYFPGSRYRWGYGFGQMHANFQEPLNYRGKADYDVWLGNLQRRETDLLFIYSLHQTDTIEFPLEDAWARQNPHIFQQVFSNAIVRVYRLSRAIL